MDMKLWIGVLKMVGIEEMHTNRTVCTSCESEISVTNCDKCNKGTCRECSVIITKKLSPEITIQHRKCRRD